MEQSSTNDLGTRILNAARLAVAMHLAQQAQDASDVASNQLPAGRKVVIGGTGPRFVTDDAPTLASSADRAARDSQSRAA